MPGGELCLLFQPIVSLADQRVTGVEALLRWRHPTLGDVPPAEFLPIAERAGLIGELQRWALEEAATAAGAACPRPRPTCASASTCRPATWPPARWSATSRPALRSSRARRPSGWCCEIGDGTVSSERRARRRSTSRRCGSWACTWPSTASAADSSLLTHLTRLPIDIVKLDRALRVRASTGTRRPARCASRSSASAGRWACRRRGRGRGDLRAAGRPAAASAAASRRASCSRAPCRCQQLMALLSDGAGAAWPALVGSSSPR